MNMSDNPSLQEVEDAVRRTADALYQDPARRARDAVGPEATIDWTFFVVNKGGVPPEVFVALVDRLATVRTELRYPVLVTTTGDPTR